MLLKCPKFFLTVSVMALFSCTTMSCKKDKTGSVDFSDEKKPRDSSLANFNKTVVWDNASIVKIADGNYGRVKELKNHQLVAVYSRSSNLYIKLSDDEGKSWVNETVIFTGNEKYAMANAEIIQLNDGTLIAATNRRVKTEYHNKGYTYAIIIKRSKDLGKTWVNEKMIFEAGQSNDVGCWEPSFLQLPNGELQCYFANEFPYKDNQDQEISMLRSMDNGLSWSANPVTISYAKNGRDGMPVPIFDAHTNTIMVAIEDNPNANHLLQPAIVKTSLTDNWSSGSVNEKSVNRVSLMPFLKANEYAGAPYIAQFETGEIILVCQDRRGRTIDKEQAYTVLLNRSLNKVYAQSKPFNTPLAESSLWNAVTVLENQKIILVTSNKGIYLIKGQLKQIQE